MKLRSSKLFPKAWLALAITAGCTTVAAESAQDVLDGRQETQIKTTYALSPYLRANVIQVFVHTGKATLTGIVPEDVHKDLATQIALGVDGIEAVDNQIIVTADYLPPARVPGERSYGEVIDDAGITMAVKSKLLWSKHTDGLQMEVTTRNGFVTLRGTADTEAAKELAGLLALNTHDVTSVSNELVVANGPSLADQLVDAGSAAGKQISDSWITTKVMSTFIYSSNVSTGDISVATADGVVTLSGKVGSSAERALAIELAQNVRGVRDVKAAGLGI
jgi:hyperosmotically inducible protein